MGADGDDERTIAFVPEAGTPGGDPLAPSPGGDQVAPSPGGDQVAPSPGGDQVAMVVVRRGPNAGSRYLLDADVTRAGRHPDADIFLDDVTVSRHHAEIIRRGATFVVRDDGSLNGTYVNRERVEEATLRHGDELQVGKFRLVFFAGSTIDET